MLLIHCLLLSPLAVFAQAETDALTQRATLFTSLPEVEQAFKPRGIDLKLDYTNFVQRLYASSDNNKTEISGRGDLVLKIDGDNAPFWKGFGIELRHTMTHGDANFGRGFGNGGVFFPPNTALTFPRRNETSFSVHQRFDNNMRLSLGKFDVLTATEAMPLSGGGGMNSFTNLALAAPVTGIISPYAVGGILNIPTQHANYTLMVYDPRNGQDPRTIGFTFEAGMAAMLNVTLPLKWAGKPGYHTFTGALNDVESEDLESPPDMPSTIIGQWYVAYALQQFIGVHEADPSKGWGFFGRIGASDSNPNAIAGHWLLGLGGHNLLGKRQQDRWGIAMARYYFSDHLNNPATPPPGRIGPESVIEAYYNLAVFPWLRVTLSAQRTRPFVEQKKEDSVVTLRTQIRF